MSPTPMSSSRYDSRQRWRRGHRPRHRRPRPLEAVTGLVGRAFAVAEVTAPDAIKAALGPATLALIGRSLIRTRRDCVCHRR